jgi:hypothetical protein
MSKVFFGGSRNLSRLNSEIRSRLNNLIANKHTVLIGDSNGVDKAVQSFFAETGYNNVIVYCMDGGCRNNVGGWPTKVVESGGRKKDFAYFVMKDQQMSLDSDYGFMIWDGESKGTLNNVLNLIQQNKHALVYVSHQKEFVPVKSTDDLESIIANCPNDLIDYLNKKIKLESRVASTNQFALGF